MKKIWKYTIPLSEKFTIGLPAGAKILTVQVQNDVPCIWVELDDRFPTKIRSFQQFSTGEEFGEEFNEYQIKYIGTYQLQDGKLVLHLYEELGK